jgi:hypothetical protein
LSETQSYSQEQVVAKLLVTNDSQQPSGQQVIRNVLEFGFDISDAQIGQSVSYKKFGVHTVVHVPHGGDEAIFLRGEGEVAQLMDGEEVFEDAVPPLNAEHELGIVRNSDFEIDVRASALWKVVREAPENARQFVLEILSSDANENGLALRSLAVFASKRLRFEDKSERRTIWLGLLNFATSHSELGNPSDISAAVSVAIQRLGALIPEKEAEQLVPLLSYNGGLDTRTDCLESLAIVFSLAPAQHPLESLKARVFQLSKKFLDSDLLVAGSTSLVAQKSIAVLCCLDRALLSDVCVLVRAIGFPWFSRVVAKGLRTQISQWDSEKFGSEIEEVETLARDLTE